MAVIVRDAEAGRGETAFGRHDVCGWTWGPQHERCFVSYVTRQARDIDTKCRYTTLNDGDTF